jgi:hypothetical protein
MAPGGVVGAALGMVGAARRCDVDFLGLWRAFPSAAPAWDHALFLFRGLSGTEGTFPNRGVC